MIIDGKNIAKIWKKFIVCVEIFTVTVFWRIFINLTFRKITQPKCQM